MIENSHVPVKIFCVGHLQRFSQVALGVRRFVAHKSLEWRNMQICPQICPRTEAVLSMSGFAWKRQKATNEDTFMQTENKVTIRGFHSRGGNATPSLNLSLSHVV
jgi:hypothetical protein